jgi:predicted membrane protein
MFNFLKIFLILGFIKHYKRNITTILISIILMMITIFVTNDILKIVPRADKFTVFTIKWFLLFLIILIILFNLYRIFKKKVIVGNNKTTNIFKKEKKDINKTHKVRILKSGSLESKGEQIFNRYRKEKE